MLVALDMQQASNEYFEEEIKVHLGSTIYCGVKSSRLDMRLQQETLIQAVCLARGLLAVLGSHALSFHSRCPKRMAHKVYRGTMRDGTEVAIKARWICFHVAHCLSAYQVLQVPEEAGFEEEIKASCCSFSVKAKHNNAGSVEVSASQPGHPHGLCQTCSHVASGLFVGHPAWDVPTNGSFFTLRFRMLL